MKRNKIIVALCPDDELREKMVRKLAIRLGFARNETDAKRIIKINALDYDLPNTYFVLASNYSLRRSPETTQRLYQMALSGMAVVVGVKRIYPEHEFMCEIYYPDEVI